MFKQIFTDLKLELGNAMQKLFFQLCISDEQDDTVVSKLMLLSRLNMESSPPKIDIEWDAEIAVRALQKMLDNTDEGLIKLIRERVPLQNAETLKRLVVSRRVEACLERGATNGDISLEPKKSTKRAKRGYDVFMELLEKPIRRDYLSAKMLEAGYTPSTTASYVTWSRRSLDLKEEETDDTNPFGFLTVDFKDRDGVKWICKMGEVPQEYKNG